MIFRHAGLLIKFIKKIKYIFLACFILLIIVLVLPIKYNKYNYSSPEPTSYEVPKKSSPPQHFEALTLKIPSEAEFRYKSVERKLKIYGQRPTNEILEKLHGQGYPVTPNYDVFTFYYSWSKSKNDEAWGHWNYDSFPDVHNGTKKNLNRTEYITSNFYPELGPYDSWNKSVLRTHMKQIRKTGIGVLIVPWKPVNSYLSDDFFQNILDTAAEYSLKIAPQIEKYDNRHIPNLRSNIEYLFNNYGFHEAFYKIKRDRIHYPVYFIDEFFTIDSIQWQKLLHKHGNYSVRGTIYDGIFFGLILSSEHRFSIKAAHFDGYYTYHAINGYSYASTWKNWPDLMKYAIKNGLKFIPCVGPGYIDTATKPWNSKHTRPRIHGNYYEVGWRQIMEIKAHSVGISTFNDWHGGSQIEPAISVPGKAYLDYQPEGPDFYLDLTQWWVYRFSKKNYSVEY